MVDIQSMLNFFGGMQNMQTRFNNFATNFQQMGQNPQQMVQQMLNDGRMTQEQFNQLSAAANQLMGKKF